MLLDRVESDSDLRQEHKQDRTRANAIVNYDCDLCGGTDMSIVAHRFGKERGEICIRFTRVLGIAICIALLGCQHYTVGIGSEMSGIVFDDIQDTGDIRVVSHGNVFSDGFDASTGSVVKLAFNLVNESGRNLAIVTDTDIARVLSAIELPIPSWQEDASFVTQTWSLVWESTDRQVAVYWTPDCWRYSKPNVYPLCGGVPLTLLHGSGQRGRPGNYYPFVLDVWIPTTTASQLQLEIRFRIGLLVENRIVWRQVSKDVRVRIVPPREPHVLRSEAVVH